MTQAIFAEIIETTPAHIVTGYISGPDQGEPVVAFLKQRNIDVVDMRPSSAFYERDSLQPFDEHPGSIAQYHYFNKLMSYFVSKGMDQAQLLRLISNTGEGRTRQNRQGRGLAQS